MYRQTTKRIASLVGCLTAALLAGIALPSTTSAQSTPKVAVMPIEDASGQFDAETIDQATEYLRGAIASADRFIVVGGGRQDAKLDELIDEQKKESYKECYAEKCQIEVGKALAADTIVRTKITHLGTCIVNIEMIDLAREASVDAAQQKFACESANLTDAFDRAVEHLGTDNTSSSETYSDDAPDSSDESAPDRSASDKLFAKGRKCHSRDDMICAKNNFATSCQRGKPAGCAWLGMLYERGQGVQRDIERAQHLYERACRKDDAMGCNRLGELYGIEGKGPARDLEKARRLFEKACQRNDPIGCRNLGVAYADGDGGEKDLDRARELYEMACESSGGLTGCEPLGVMYREGTAVQKDLDKARELQEKACSQNKPPGCLNLGFFYEQALGVERDLDRARRLYERACDGGLEKACQRRESLDE